MAVVDILQAKINVDDLREQLRPQGWRLVHESELHLVQLSRYVERFFELCETQSTNQEAFDKLEAEYFDLFGVNRYSSFESFTRSAASIRQRKKRGG